MKQKQVGQKKKGRSVASLLDDDIHTEWKIPRCFWCYFGSHACFHSPSLLLTYVNLTLTCSVLFRVGVFWNMTRGGAQTTSQQLMILRSRLSLLDCCNTIKAMRRGALFFGVLWVWLLLMTSRKWSPTLGNFRMHRKRRRKQSDDDDCAGWWVL